MKRVLTLIVLLVLTIALGVVSYRYLTIRKGNHVYFMEKTPGTFGRVYLDVSRWSFVDYGMHPKIAAFLVARGVRKTGGEWKEKLKEKLDAAPKEMKLLKDKASEN